MIESLELENWKSHSRTSFSFAKGTNVLLGMMGSWKSSVLDALCFALYGTFPKMSRRDQSTESVVNIRSGAEYASVKLVFGKGGKEYEITRRIGKKLTEAEIREGGKLLQKGAKPVTDLVVEALGVDYELFTRAIYSEQNRMDQLLTLTPRARKGEIDYLLGLGKFDEARDGAQAAYGKLLEQTEALKAEATEESISQARESLQSQEKNAQEAAASCEALAKKSAELAAELEKKAAGLTLLEKTRKEWAAKKRECDMLRGAAERLARETEGKTRVSKAELSQLEIAQKGKEGDLLAAKEEAKKARKAHEEAVNELAAIQSEAKASSERKARVERLEKRAAELSEGKDREQIELELAASKKEEEGISKEHSRLSAEIEELEISLATLMGAGAKCPVCDSDLPHEKQKGLLAEKKSLLEGKRRLQAEKAGLIEEKRQGRELRELTFSELKLCIAELASLKPGEKGEGEIAALFEASKAKKAALEAEVKKAEEGVSGLEALLSEARDELAGAKTLERLFFDYDIGRERLEKAEKALFGISFSEEDYEAVRKGAEALLVESARVKSELSGEEKRKKLVGDMRALLERELSAKLAKQELAGKYAIAAESMAIYKNALSAAQSELRADLVEEINQALSEIWPAVYPYSDYGGVFLEAGEKDYRLMMHKEGWKEVDSVASGGERACLCLALRVAFATVLTPDVGWLILDEPTHNLDSDAVQLLSEAISHKIPAIVEQTLVITHEPALGETSEGAVFRLERDKAAGEDTKVAQ